jgi:hypothetical protein
VCSSSKFHHLGLCVSRTIFRMAIVIRYFSWLSLKCGSQATFQERRQNWCDKL